VPFRLPQVRRALEHIAAHADRVWLTQPAAVHDAFVKLAPPPPADAAAPAFLSAPTTRPQPQP
jgi:hypothetical protein